MIEDIDAALGPNGSAYVVPMNELNGFTGLPPLAAEDEDDEVAPRGQHPGEHREHREGGEGEGGEGGMGDERDEGGEGGEGARGGQQNGWGEGEREGEDVGGTRV